MLKRIYTASVSLLFLALFSFSCTSPPVQKSPASVITPVQEPPPRIEFTGPSELYYHYLMGQVCASLKNWSCASQELTAAITYDQQSTFLSMQIAYTYTYQGKFDQAISWCEKTLAMDPDVLSAHELLGRIYSALHKLDLAIAQYSIICEKKNNEDSFVTLALLYKENNEPDKAVAIIKDLIKKNKQSERGYFFLANLYSDLDNFELAEKYYYLALEKKPDFEAARINLAQLYERYEHLDKAVKLFDKILKSDPDNYRIRNRLSYVLVKTNKLEDALAHYSIIKQQRPEFSEEISIKIGLIYYQQENWSDAIAEFTIALTKNPNNHRALYYLGNLYEKTERFDESIATLKRIPEDSTFYSEARMLLSYLHERKGDKEASKKIMLDAIQIKKDDSRLYRFLASLYEQEKNFSRGVDILKQALLIDPDDEETLFLLGVLYDKLSRFDESIDIFKQILQINDLNADALNYIGYTYADKGIYLDEAEKFIKKALAIKPDDGYITDSLGWLYYKKGKYKKALKLLIKANKLSPGDPIITEHLGDAYIKNKMPDEAKLMYKKVLELDSSKQDVQKKLDLLERNR